MKIEILSQKYKVGCERGINYIDKPGLLTKLNMIIEWPKCSFPQEFDHDEERVTGKIDDNGNPVIETVHIFKENRNFLGDEPELQPGNCFKLDGQLIAVDGPNRLVLMISETGGFALQRLWEEKIAPEIEMTFNDYDTDDVEMSDLDLNNIPKGLESGKIEWKYWNLWRNQFTKIEKRRVTTCEAAVDDLDAPDEIKKILKDAAKNGTNVVGVGPGNLPQDINLAGSTEGEEIEVEVSDYRPKKCILHSDDLVIPMTLYMMEHNFLYSPEDMDEETAKEAVMHVISWVVDNNHQY